ncbi:hypothetical protein BgiBS90_036916 [Biomphalaria glabrata]|nr:hypothetical protein BgiBS90_036916 [Biomphalaria glabrata]
MTHVQCKPECFLGLLSRQKQRNLVAQAEARYIYHVTNTSQLSLTVRDAGNYPLRLTPVLLQLPVTRLDAARHAIPQVFCSSNKGGENSPDFGD